MILADFLELARRPTARYVATGWRALTAPARFAERRIRLGSRRSFQSAAAYFLAAVAASYVLILIARQLGFPLAENESEWSEVLVTLIGIVCVWLGFKLVRTPAASFRTVIHSSAHAFGAGNLVTGALWFLSAGLLALVSATGLGAPGPAECGDAFDCCLQERLPHLALEDDSALLNGEGLTPYVYALGAYGPILVYLWITWAVAAILKRSAGVAAWRTVFAMLFGLVAALVLYGSGEAVVTAALHWDRVAACYEGAP